MNKLKKVFASLIVLLMFFSVSPIAAHAEWQQSSNGWWYTEGSSYATGWRLLDGNWYYFYSDGYMAKNTTIDGYYLNSDGAWTTSIPATSSNSNSSYNTGVADTQSQTVYVSRNGIYHSSPTAHGMKYYTTMSRSEAEAKGYRACEKCY